MSQGSQFVTCKLPLIGAFSPSSTLPHHCTPPRPFPAVCQGPARDHTSRIMHAPSACLCTQVHARTCTISSSSATRSSRSSASAALSAVSSSRVVVCDKKRGRGLGGLVFGGTAWLIPRRACEDHRGTSHGHAVYNFPDWTTALTPHLEVLITRAPCTQDVMDLCTQAGELCLPDHMKQRQTRPE